MALAPEYYQEARETSPFHLIVTDLKMTMVEPVEVYPGFPVQRKVQVTGRAEKIIRGQELVRAGDQIAFTVPVWKEGWPSLIGGDLVTDYYELMNAQRLEAYLDGTLPQLNLVYGLVSILE